MGHVLRIAIRISVVCIGALAAIAPSEAAQLRMQSLDAADSIATTGLERLADDLRSASGGEIDILVLPAGSAVGPAATLDMMAAGAIVGQYGSPAYFARKDPAFALLGDTLALYPDPATRRTWFTEGGGLALARDLYSDHGGHLVGTVYWPEEWLVSNKAASILADLSGSVIRAPSGPISDLLQRIGAEPVALSGRDSLDRLQRGTIDAADWASLAANLASGAHRDAAYAIRARHSMPVTDIVLAKPVWERLSTSAKRLFENRVRQFSRSQEVAFRRQEANARTQARLDGVTLLDMSKTSQAAMRRHSLAVFEARGAESDRVARIAASHRAHLQSLGLVAPDGETPGN